MKRVIPGALIIVLATALAASCRYSDSGNWEPEKNPTDAGESGPVPGPEDESCLAARGEYEKLMSGFWNTEQRCSADSDCRLMSDAPHSGCDLGVGVSGIAMSEEFFGNAEEIGREIGIHCPVPLAGCDAIPNNAVSCAKGICTAFVDWSAR